MDSVCQQKEHQLTAAKADKYALYIEALQDPDADLQFIDEVYRQQSGTLPVVLREDFCGTAAISCAWVCRRLDNRAVAIDIDPGPLAWCRLHLLGALRRYEATRLELIEADVRHVTTDPADVIFVPNSSIFLLKDRGELTDYVRRCRSMLGTGGILVADVYAGPEAQRVGIDRIECDGFACLWEQAKFNAVTNVALNKVHFVFPDGTRLTDAFSYDMRIWSPAELRDAIIECGFSRTSAFIRRNTDDGLPGSEPRRCECVEVSDTWDAYLVGLT